MAVHFANVLLLSFLFENELFSAGLSAVDAAQSLCPPASMMGHTMLCRRARWLKQNVHDFQSFSILQAQAQQAQRTAQTATLKAQQEAAARKKAEEEARKAAAMRMSQGMSPGMGGRGAVGGMGSRGSRGSQVAYPFHLAPAITIAKQTLPNPLRQLLKAQA